MKKLFLLVACAAGLGACTFPQTKMQPVGAAQTQQPATGDTTPASPQSAATTR